MAAKAKDDALKSAYELALERLSERDREEGVEAPRPLDAAQKARIADLRARARAKLAEIEILYRKDRATTAPDARDELDERYRTDRARVDSWLESQIARVRKGEEPEDDAS